MNELPEDLHPSHSGEQTQAEAEILRAVERQYGVKFSGQPQIETVVKLDGFADGEKPFCVEVWAHQGPAKGSQPHKVMRDFCKLVLVQKLLGKTCTLLFVGCDPRALEFLDNSWHGEFAKEFGIRYFVVPISEATRVAICEAQKRQFR